MAALLALWAAASQADGDYDYEEAQRMHREGLIVSLESILTQAQAIHPGDLLEVELEKKDGRPIYEVEILDTEGVTWKMKFTAEDGHLYKEKRKKD